MIELPEQRKSPVADRALSRLPDDGTTILGQTVAHFRHRVLCDALQEATAAYWLRRATAFEAVGTPDCDAVAGACRNRAALAEFEDFDDLAALALAEVGA